MHWLLWAFQIAMGFVVLNGLYRVWATAWRPHPTRSLGERARSRRKASNMAPTRLPGEDRHLTLQRLQLLDGGDGGEAGGVAGGSRKLGLGGHQLGCDDGLIELLDVPGALGQDGNVGGIDLGKATLSDEDALPRARRSSDQLDHARPQGRDHRSMAGQGP